MCQIAPKLQITTIEHEGSHGLKTNKQEGATKIQFSAPCCPNVQQLFCSEWNKFFFISACRKEVSAESCLPSAGFQPKSLSCGGHHPFSWGQRWGQ